jgi:hypothetical protein
MAKNINRQALIKELFPTEVQSHSEEDITSESDKEFIESSKKCPNNIKRTAQLPVHALNSPFIKHLAYKFHPLADTYHENFSQCGRNAALVTRQAALEYNAFLIKNIVDGNESPEWRQSAMQRLYENLKALSMSADTCLEMAREEFKCVELVRKLLFREDATPQHQAVL